MVILAVYGVKNHPADHLSWSDALIEYYVQVSDDPKRAQQAGFTAHSLVFESFGFRSFGRTSNKSSRNDEGFWSQKQSKTSVLSRTEFFELWQRGTYLFGVRLYHIVLTLPALLLVCALCIQDGLRQRSIRKACVGHESASLYHRAKHLSFTLAAPFAGAVYLCSPWAYHPVYFLFPAMVLTGILLRTQYTFYKKYV